MKKSEKQKEYNASQRLPKMPVNCAPANEAPTVLAKVLIIRIVASGFWILALNRFQIVPSDGLCSVMRAISVLERLSKHASIKEQQNENDMATKRIMTRTAMKTSFRNQNRGRWFFDNLIITLKYACDFIQI